MSGYNRLEQAVGHYLNDFPRIKGAVETTYQRASYLLFANRDFKYKLHDDVPLHTAPTWFGAEDGTLDEFFVGFYDVCPWNEDQTQYVVHELDESSGTVSISVLGKDGSERIASTDAWNYQQGARTRWHPTQKDALIFNDIENGNAVARIVNTDGEELDRYQQPMQAMNPTGEDFLSINYRRLDHNSPAYGYGTDDGSELATPAEDGIVRIDRDGNTELIVSFRSLISEVETAVDSEYHYIHHGLYAPDGDQFAFLHRWVDDGQRQTRLLVSNRFGKRRLLLENEYVSHYCWLDTKRLFLWGGSKAHGRGYHIVDTESGEIDYVEGLSGYGDGHPTLSPDGEWVVTDTYPDRTRKRTLWLYNIYNSRSIKLGNFLAPFEFDGGYRCDLHPRWSRDGKFISIDSAHEGVRKSYILDVSSVCQFE
ncbi:hypothetical protein SAMN04487967_2297 [Natronorubrum sediminis]|uniref:Oligogalacturonide lyase n=1 Tax=Natronorubrum sediminis TaxID=640943 RepID=A0A1H6FYK3_9EURY|nr:hypothetical protein [Natronorubrum sediminis]SEH15899.1 hypothetical protein SAMN04487967_2297 [Natronorubrum sediminis]